MIGSYLKIAYKVFLRRKFFTFISLFAIAFTLVVLMVATALLDHMFGPMAPEINQGRTLGVFHLQMTGPHSINGSNPGYMFLDKYVRTLAAVERVSIHSEPAQVAAFKDGARLSLYLKRTDGEFWKILQFQFLEGGPLTADDEANANFVAVVNASTRTRLFGDGPALGKSLEVDGQRFRIVGVVADVPMYRMVPFADVWVPISTSKSDAYKRTFTGRFMGMILARSRADLPTIRRAFQERLPSIELPDPKTYTRLQSSADTFFESVSREFFGYDMEDTSGPALLGVLLTLGLTFMVLPTINLININVSRILERASEIGVRKAFGASRRTLVVQFVIENVALCLVGGAIGLVLSFMVLRVITASGVIPYAQFHLNLRIFLYGLALAVVFGVLSGTFPAWKMSRLHPVEALRGRSR